MVKLSRWPRALTPDEDQLIEQTIADYKATGFARLNVGDYGFQIRQDKSWDLPEAWEDKAIVVSRAHNDFWNYLDRLETGEPPEPGKEWGKVTYPPGKGLKTWVELVQALLDRLSGEGFIILSYPSNDKLDKQYQRLDWKPDPTDANRLIYRGLDKVSVTTVMTPEKQQALDRFWDGYNGGTGKLTLGEYTLTFRRGGNGVSVILQKGRIPMGETSAPSSGMVRMMGLVRPICDRIVASGKVLLCIPVTKDLSDVYKHFGWREITPGKWGFLYYGDRELIPEVSNNPTGLPDEFVAAFTSLEQGMQEVNTTFEETQQMLSRTQRRIEELEARLGRTP